VRRSTLFLAAVLALPAAAIPLAPASAQEKKETLSERIDKLVQKLGAEDYATREQAQKDLTALGRPALPALEKAAKESTDAEVRARAAEAATTIRKGLGIGPGQQPAPEKEKERNGELEPDEPPIVDPTPTQPMPQPKLDDVFKSVPKDLPQEILKMLERFQKQLDDMDRQDQSQGEEKEIEIPGGRGKIKTWTFSNAPRAGNKDAIERRLGLGLGPTTAALRAQLSLGPTEGGVVVNELTPGSWAEKSGIQLYDVIIAVDGRAVRTSVDLATLLEKGGKVDVIRKAKLEKLDVAGAAPNPATPPAAPKKDDANPPLRKF
jgi:hypothetical protein